MEAFLMKCFPETFDPELDVSRGGIEGAFLVFICIELDSYLWGADVSLSIFRHYLDLVKDLKLKIEAKTDQGNRLELVLAAFRKKYMLWSEY